MDRYDAIVIGAGHNGLINGAYLARAGIKTLILERRHLVGMDVLGRHADVRADRCVLG